MTLNKIKKNSIINGMILKSKLVKTIILPKHKKKLSSLINLALHKMRNLIITLPHNRNTNIANKKNLINHY